MAVKDLNGAREKTFSLGRNLHEWVNMAEDITPREMRRLLRSACDHVDLILSDLSEREGSNA